MTENSNDTKSKATKGRKGRKKTDKVPEPHEVRAMTVDDVIADNLEQRSSVVKLKKRDNTEEWVRVSYKKPTHSEWIELGKTGLDSEGTGTYHRTLIHYCSVEPSYPDANLKEGTDAGFVLQYGKLLEAFMRDIHFL